MDGFLPGQLPDLLEPAVGGNGGPRDWGVRMDASLLAMRMNAEVTQALSAPSSTVFLSNRGVQVSVGASGDHLGAVCTAFLEVATGVLGVTVVVELRLTVDLRTTGPGVLEAHAAIHIALVKSIDTAALLVVAGAAIGAALGLAAVIIPGGVVALPLIVIGGVVVLGSLGPLPVNVLPSSAGRTCSETGLTVDYLDLSADKSITCTMPVGERLPLTRNAAFEMSSLFALGEDVVATGTISPLPTLPAPVWSLSTGDWDWEPPRYPVLSCNGRGPDGRAFP